MEDQKRRIILLVEDETVIALAEKAILGRNGYEVIVAGTGEKAVDLAGSGTAIDLVLMDINLGKGMDGTEAAERILKSRDLPVVFLSSHTEPEVVEKTEKITSYGYIVKNSGPTVLLASIKMAFRLFEAKKAARERSERNSALLEASPDFMFLFDRDGIFRDYSAPDERLLAVPPSLFIGRHAAEALPPEIAELTRDKLAAVFESGRPQLYEYDLDVGGKKGSYESRLVLCGKDSALAIVRDITDWKQDRAALARQLGLQKVLVEMAATFLAMRPGDLSKAVDRALATMAKAVGADRAFIFEYDFSAGCAVNTFEWCAPGVTPHIESLQAVPLEHIDAAVALHRDGDIHYIPDTALLPHGDMKRLLEAQGIKSLLTVPLVSDGVCLGNVGFDFVRGRRECSEAEITLLKIFAGLIVNAEDRRKVEAALLESEHRYRDLVEGANSIILKLDGAGRVRFMNAFAEQTFGYPREEVIGRDVVGTLVPQLDGRQQDMRLVMENIILHPESYLNNENENITRDGRRLWVSWTNRVFTGADGDAEILCIGQDATDRKRAEERVLALLEEKELLLLESHHRVKNNMNVIKSMLSLHAAEHENTECGRILGDAAGRVQNMLSLYEKLYRPDGGGSLNAGEFLPSLVEEILAVFHGRDVAASVQVEDFRLDPETLSALGIIINELITNSMKHAFNGPSGGHRIALSAVKRGGIVSIEYSDNGPGIPEEPVRDSSGGFGMRLIGMLAKQIDATITAGGGAGTRFIIEFEARDE